MKKHSAKKIEREETGHHGHAHNELGKLENAAFKRMHHR